MLAVGGVIGVGVVLIRALSLAGFALVAALLLLAALICAALVLHRRWRRLLDTHRTLVRQPPPEQVARLAAPEEARLWTGLIDPPTLGIVGRDDVV
ncbi:MAG TPA: hypothetical protein VFS21_33095 [Roseiflexaceae bacterium]|nr:hypothetical protein [Roseiflexaceae bacterium]